MREKYVRTHALMVELNIPHDYVDGPKRDPRWDTAGWKMPFAWLPNRLHRKLAVGSCFARAC
jgi:hypothetical protein